MPVVVGEASVARAPAQVLCRVCVFVLVSFGCDEMHHTLMCSRRFQVYLQVVGHTGYAGKLQSKKNEEEKHVESYDGAKYLHAYSRL